MELFSVAWQLLVDHSMKHLDDNIVYGPDSFEIDISHKTLKELTIASPANEFYILPDNIDETSSQDGFIYTVGIMIAELFFGTSINYHSLADISVFASEDPEGSLFSESDFDLPEADYLTEEAKNTIINIIIQMTSFSLKKRLKGAEAFCALGKGIGCEYEILCYAPNGNSETAFNVQINFDENHFAVAWPDDDPPVKTLSDGKTYSFLPLTLHFLPGKHKCTLFATNLFEPNPISNVESDEPSPPEVQTELVENNDKFSPETVLGLDLGTETTCVINGNGDILCIDDFSEIIPSVLFFENAHKIQIGIQAKHRSQMYPNSAIRGFKRHIGENTVVNDGLEAADGTEIRCTGSDASSFFVAELTNKLAEYNDMDYRKIVVTVPAMFDPVRRRETINAIISAGYNEDDIRLLEEPIAAAMYYDCESDEGLTAVFDLGGGTFDFTLIHNHQVIGVSGALKIGGIDFTTAIINIIKEKCNDEGHPLPKRTTNPEIARLYHNLIEGAETAKIELSFQESAEVYIENYYSGIATPLRFTVTRREFEEKIREYIVHIKEIVFDSLQNAGYTPSQIDRVVIMGGSTHIPCIDNLIKNELFPECGTFLSHDRFCAVARGAAKLSRNLWCEHTINVNEYPAPYESDEIISRIPCDLGIVTANRRFECIVPKNTVYSDDELVESKTFDFQDRNQSAIRVPIYTRSPECSLDVLPIMARERKGFKKIGTISFDNINFGNMLENFLKVEIGIDCDGAIICRGNIINRESDQILASVSADIIGV